MAGVWTGCTPLENQYSGRQIRAENWLVFLAVKFAAVTSGKIHVGAVPGALAQVMVPACCGPGAADGIFPNAPLKAAGPVPEEQAASAVAHVTISAAIATPGRVNLVIARSLSFPLHGRVAGGSVTPWPPGEAQEHHKLLPTVAS